MNTRSCVQDLFSRTSCALKNKSLYGFTSFSDPMHAGMAQFIPARWLNTNESSSTSSRSNSLSKLLYRPLWTCGPITQFMCWSIGLTASTSLLKLVPLLCKCLATCAVAMSHTENSRIKSLISSKSGCLKEIRSRKFFLLHGNKISIASTSTAIQRKTDYSCSDCNKTRTTLLKMSIIKILNSKDQCSKRKRGKCGIWIKRHSLSVVKLTSVQMWYPRTRSPPRNALWKANQTKDGRAKSSGLT